MIEQLIGESDMSNLDEIRDSEGNLPAYAWPGGYPMYYFDKCGNTVCPKCANRDVDDSQAVVAYGIHWEGEPITCDDCGDLIESAYGEREAK